MLTFGRDYLRDPQKEANRSWANKSLYTPRIVSSSVEYGEDRDVDQYPNTQTLYNPNQHSRCRWVDLEPYLEKLGDLDRMIADRYYRNYSVVDIQHMTGISHPSLLNRIERIKRILLLIGEGALKYNAYIKL